MIRRLSDGFALSGSGNERVTVTDIYRINDVVNRIENIQEEIQDSINNLSIIYAHDSRQCQVMAHLKRDIVHLFATCQQLKKVSREIFI